jgi:hypothetical protein
MPDDTHTSLRSQFSLVSLEQRLRRSKGEQGSHTAATQDRDVPSSRARKTSGAPKLEILYSDIIEQTCLIRRVERQPLIVCWNRLRLADFSACLCSLG